MNKTLTNEEKLMAYQTMFATLVGTITYFVKYTEIEESYKKRMLMNLKETLDRNAVNDLHIQWSNECFDLLNSMK